MGTGQRLKLAVLFSNGLSAHSTIQLHFLHTLMESDNVGSEFPLLLSCTKDDFTQTVNFQEGELIAYFFCHLLGLLESVQGLVHFLLVQPTLGDSQQHLSLSEPVSDLGHYAHGRVVSRNCFLNISMTPVDVRKAQKTKCLERSVPVLQSDLHRLLTTLHCVC